MKSTGAKMRKSLLSLHVLSLLELLWVCRTMESYLKSLRRFMLYTLEERCEVARKSPSIAFGDEVLFRGEVPTKEELREEIKKLIG